MPRPIAIFFILLGAISLMIGGALYWAQTTLLDEFEVRGETVAALRSPEGRALVAGEVWAELEREVPGVRLLNSDVAEGVIARFLDRDSLDPLYARSAQLVYQELIAPGSGAITLDLGEEYPLIVETLLGVDPDFIARFVPLDRLGPVVLVEEGQLPDLSPIEPATDLGVPLFVALGGVSLLFGLWLARRRRWALATAGVALVAAGLLQRLIVPAARDRLLEPVVDPDVLTVMEDVMDGLLASLRAQSALFVWVGVALVALNLVTAGGLGLWRRRA